MVQAVSDRTQAPSSQNQEAKFMVKEFDKHGYMEACFMFHQGLIWHQGTAAWTQILSSGGAIN